MPETLELAPVQMSVSEIKYALEHNMEFFIQFFMGEELTLDVPEFHPEILELMINKQFDNFACAMPRDHAKTTLAKLAALHYVLFSDYRFVLYMSLTVSIAIPSVNDIVNFMETDNFIAVFGIVEFTMKQDGKGIYVFKVGGKHCILRAFGAGMQVRGVNVLHQRPQLVICDDIEEEMSKELFTKLKRWFYGPFKKCINKMHHKLIQIGNLTSNQSLIAEHCQSRFWHSRVYGCLLSNGQPLWPDAWTIEKLKQDFAEYLENGMADVWFAEMMNMPSAGGRGIILAEEITYRPMRQVDDIDMGFITIDLAISAETWAHETVICVHGWVEEGGINGEWQVVDYIGFRGIDPISLFWEVIKLCRKWHIKTVGIEAVAYQASLKYVFEHECLRNGIAVVTDDLPQPNGIAFVQLQAIGRKPMRIIAWAAMLKAGEYVLNEGDFIMTQQAIAYRPDKKENNDDYIDCAAYAPQMMERYMYLIARKFSDQPDTQIQNSYQLCRQS